MSIIMIGLEGLKTDGWRIYDYDVQKNTFKHFIDVCLSMINIEVVVVVG